MLRFWKGFSVPEHQNVVSVMSFAFLCGHKQVRLNSLTGIPISCIQEFVPHRTLSGNEKEKRSGSKNWRLSQGFSQTHSLN
jgi:hypothetical protein